jgi:hypothetical protein
MHDLFDLFRQPIVRTQSEYSFLIHEIEMNEPYFGGRRKGNQGRGGTGKILVFA